MCGQVRVHVLEVAARAAPSGGGRKYTVGAGGLRLPYTSSASMPARCGGGVMGFEKQFPVSRADLRVSLPLSPIASLPPCLSLPLPARPLLMDTGSLKVKVKVASAFSGSAELVTWG